MIQLPNFVFSHLIEKNILAKPEHLLSEKIIREKTMPPATFTEVYPPAPEA